MNRHSQGTASVSVTMARIPTHRDDLSHLACMSCGVGLELHQADPDLTERLLGVCTVPALVYPRLGAGRGPGGDGAGTRGEALREAR